MSAVIAAGTDARYLVPTTDGRRCDHCGAPIGPVMFRVAVRGGFDLLTCSRRCQSRAQ